MLEFLFGCRLKALAAMIFQKVFENGVDRQSPFQRIHPLQRRRFFPCCQSHPSLEVKVDRDTLHILPAGSQTPAPQKHLECEPPMR